MGKPVYKRVLLKLSGEAMASRESGENLSSSAINNLVSEIKELCDAKVQVAVVVGGGNIFRGAFAKDIERSTADFIGMLGTMMNGLALQNFLEKQGVQTVVMSAIEIPKLASPCNPTKAVMHLEEGKVVIFGGGTGNPYFSTDTTAALRALEIHADVVLKGTKVLGVYDSDPIKNPNAKFFEELSYIEVLQKGLKVMDATAISMCMENQLPIIVFNVFEKGNAKKVVMGQKVGTKVYGKTSK